MNNSNMVYQDPRQFVLPQNYGQITANYGQNPQTSQIMTQTLIGQHSGQNISQFGQNIASSLNPNISPNMAQTMNQNLPQNIQNISIQNQQVLPDGNTGNG